MDGGGWAFGFLLSFVGMLTGLVLGVWAITGSRRTASAAGEILANRLAYGEITPAEYEERRRVLEPEGSGPKPALRLLAVALVVLGLAGSVAIPATRRGIGSGWWGGMMHGPMMGNVRSGGSAPAPEAGARQVRVVGTDFAFSPDGIRLKTGETVNVVFDNRGDAFHTFTIPKLDFELRASSGARAEGALSVRSPGNYEFVCSVSGHAEAGMRGRLTVSPTSTGTLAAERVQ